MSAVQYMFDTLRYSNELKSSGIDAKQAEAYARAQALVFNELVDTKLATKDDINEVEQKIYGVRTELTSEIIAFRYEMYDQMRNVEMRIGGVEIRLNAVEIRLNGVEHRLNGVENRLAGIESRLFIKLTSVMTAGVGLLAGLMAIFHVS